MVFVEYNVLRDVFVLMWELAKVVLIQIMMRRQAASASNWTIVQIQLDFVQNVSFRDAQVVLKDLTLNVINALIVERLLKKEFVHAQQGKSLILKEYAPIVQ